MTVEIHAGMLPQGMKTLIIADVSEPLDPGVSDRKFGYSRFGVASIARRPNNDHRPSLREDCSRFHKFIDRVFGNESCHEQNVPAMLEAFFQGQRNRLFASVRNELAVPAEVLLPTSSNFTRIVHESTSESSREQGAEPKD
jgi:hypothetical protein